MKIGYDAKRFFLNNTGLGNYSRWLVKSLASFYPENQYLLYSPKRKPNNRINFIEGFNNIQTILPEGKLFKSYWRSCGIVKDLKRDGIEIYHGLSHELPSGIQHTGIKTVVSVHDVIVLKFPQYFGAINRFIYINKLKHACRVADRIIAITERTKQDLIELLQVDPAKIDVVYQGCDASFKTVCADEQKQAVKKKYNLPDDFILYVGTIEERKNLLLIIKALALIPQPPMLVAVGRPTPYADKVKAEIEKLNLTDKVKFIHQVDFAHLPAIYQMAGAFVYPSRYEGFGIPVLEALCSGVPAIAATGSCLEEAGGPDSLYVDPDDATGFATYINQVLNDEPLRQKMITAGYEYSRNFDDDKLAADLMAVYRNVNLPKVAH